MPRTPLPDLPAAGDVAGWRRLGDLLQVSPGVHRPSGFSAVLAARVPDVRGRVVIDVGSGAGLLTVAALAAGARHVLAVDVVPQALHDTARNVRTLLGPAAVARVSSHPSDWSELRDLDAEVTLVNPPQRPAHLLGGAPAGDRVLFGGGHDGLDGIRAVLRYSRTLEVFSTASSLLRPGSTLLRAGAYGPPTLHASERAVHDRVWRALGDHRTAQVDVWRFVRDDDETRADADPVAVVTGAAAPA